MTEAKLSRHPQKSTEELKGLDDWYGREHAAIMRAENLTPPAKRERLDALRKEYRERWISAKAAAEKDLSEWGEIYEARADSAWEPKAPKDRDAAIMRSLELQRLAARIERHKDQPGRLIAEYERALRSGNHAAAFELENALPALLPDDERRSFVYRVNDERRKRMTEADREKLEEHKAFERERASVEQGLALQEMHRSSGFVPGQETEKRLITQYKTDRPPETYEAPNDAYIKRERTANLDLS